MCGETLQRLKESWISTSTHRMGHSSIQELALGMSWHRPTLPTIWGNEVGEETENKRVPNWASK